MGVARVYRPNTAVSGVVHNRAPAYAYYLAGGITYNAADQPTYLSASHAYEGTFPNPVAYTEGRYYNSLNQLIDHYFYRDGTLYLNPQYWFTAGHNNGQIWRRRETLGGEDITYTYDSLKRLSTAVAGASGPQWGEAYSYDGFGNLYQVGAAGGKQPGNTWSQQFDPAANRLVTGGASYDANGNMTAIPGMSGLQYDWENRLSVTPEASYFYDHNNRRIWKKNTATGAGQVMFYGLSGELRAIYNVTRTASPATLTLTLAKRYFSFGTMRFENDRLGSVTAKATTPVNHYPYRRQAPLCHLRSGDQRPRRCPEPVLFEHNAGAVPDAGSVPGKRRPRAAR